MTNRLDPKRQPASSAARGGRAGHRPSDLRREDHDDPIPDPIFQRAARILKDLRDPNWEEHARMIAGTAADKSGPGPSRPKSRRPARPDAPPEVLPLAEVADLLNTYARHLPRVSRGDGDTLVTVEREVLGLVRELVAVPRNGARNDADAVRRALWSLAPPGRPRAFDARSRLVACAALLAEHPGEVRLRSCHSCGAFFVDGSRSAKARTCSDRCRKARQRARIR